ncbi:MAG: hypothetical protein ACRD2N_16340 [Vicinamibacterales bacterium]
MTPSSAQASPTLGLSARALVFLMVGVICFSVLTVYTQYVFLHTTDHVSGRPFRDLSLEDYRDTLEGRRPFPYQWRVAGAWIARAGELATGLDPHAIDLVVKTGALAGSALFLLAFTARWASPIATLLAGALYFALTAAAYSSQGYSIYYTNDFLMVLGWFAAVYLASRGRYGLAAMAALLAAWAKETIVLVPMLAALAWWQGRASARAVWLCAAGVVIPEAILRTMYPAPLGDWAWWGAITRNVPFLRPEREHVLLALRENAKVLLLFNVFWVLAYRASRRTSEWFLRTLAIVGVAYLAMAYVVVYIRELRHFLPLAIVVIPLAMVEIDRVSRGLRLDADTR